MVAKSIHLFFYRPPSTFVGQKVVTFFFCISQVDSIWKPKGFCVETFCIAPFVRIWWPKGFGGVNFWAAPDCWWTKDGPDCQQECPLCPHTLHSLPNPLNALYAQPALGVHHSKCTVGAHLFLREQVRAMQWWPGAASSGAILIQMWNLAGPVTNGCDDVWGAQPANFLFSYFHNLPISDFYNLRNSYFHSYFWTESLQPFFCEWPNLPISLLHSAQGPWTGSGTWMYPNRPIHTSH